MPKGENSAKLHNNTPDSRTVLICTDGKHNTSASRQYGAHKAAIRCGLCILFLMGCGLAAASLMHFGHSRLHSSPEKQQPSRQPGYKYTPRTDSFTYDDVFNSSYSPRSFSPSWIQGQEAYMYRDSTGNLMAYYITEDRTQQLLSNSVFDDVKATRYYVSYDLRYVLLGYEVSRLWRHSFFAKYKIYDRQESLMKDFPGDASLQNVPLQYAGWSPSSHALTFAHSNDLYYQATPDAVSQRVTSNGDPLYIFNGIPDWLYEEEILSVHSAHYWSPASSYVLYAVFNCSKTPVFDFPYYGPASDVYGDTIRIAYPKAGDLRHDINTQVALYAMNTADVLGQKIQMLPPTELQTQDHYYIRVSWRDDTHVIIEWTNRPQNQSYTSICDVTSGICQQNHAQTIVGGWIDPGPQLKALPSGGQYLRILPRQEGGTGTWKHLTVVTSPTDSSGQVTFLTNGQYEVISIYAYVASLNMAYYIATTGDPRVRHLYRVLVADGTAAPECITCPLEPDCQYVSASFSTSGNYYVVRCLGPAIPTYALYDTAGTMLRMLEDNADILANLQQKSLPTEQYMQVDIGAGYQGWARVLIPPGATTSSHPVLVEVYAGAGSQSVTMAWQIGWQTYMASTEGVVYVKIDGRGSRRRGDQFMFLLHRHMATLEIEDQILGTQNLKSSLSYVDQSLPSGIFGWSYGGFATYHALANETDTFMCGYAGAALIDRRFYDTAHTERLMGYALPSDNEGGYNTSDVTRKVEYLRNKKLLIVHGSADDNVHYQSTAQMVKALVDAEIDFEMMMYTDKNHYFSRADRHLQRLGTDFFLKKCWART